MRADHASVLQRHQINGGRGIELVDFPPVRSLEIHPAALADIDVMTNTPIILEYLPIKMPVLLADDV
jgi:hypothetical protein